MASLPQGHILHGADTAGRPAYPRFGDLLKAFVLLGVAALFGMTTISLRFQLVDWRVQSRDLQQQLRSTEAELFALRRDVGQLAKGERLMQLATETLNLKPVDPGRIERLELDPGRVEVWSRAATWESLPEEETFADSLKPLAELVGRPDWEPSPALRRQIDQLESPFASGPPESAASPGPVRE